MAQYAHLHRDDVQLFPDILADLHHGGTATLADTLALEQLVHEFDTGQLRRQRLAFAPGFDDFGGCGLWLCFGQNSYIIRFGAVLCQAVGFVEEPVLGCRGFRAAAELPAA